MKRFRRIVGRTVNVVCVVMVLTCAALYARHLFGWDLVYFEVGSDGYASLSSHRGEMAILCADASYDFLVAVSSPALNIGPFHVIIDSRESPSLDDFKWWFDWSFASDRIYIAIPLWFLILFFAIKPAWSFMAWKRKRQRLRSDEGHPLCPACSYDLHGNTSTTCPECGVEVQP